MSTLSLRLADSIHLRIKKLAKADHISINQFAATAMAEKIAALETEDYLNNRAKAGTKKKYLKILSKVPDIKPDKNDNFLK